MKTRPIQWPDIIQGAKKRCAVNWEPETKGQTISTVTWTVSSGAGVSFSESVINGQETNVLLTASNNVGKYVVNCKITIAGISDTPIAKFNVSVIDKEIP